MIAEAAFYAALVVPRRQQACVKHGSPLIGPGAITESWVLPGFQWLCS